MQVSVLKREKDNNTKSEVDEYEPIDMDKTYTVATVTYLAEGKEGFSSLANSKFEIDPESSILLSTTIRIHWMKQFAVNPLLPSAVGDAKEKFLQKLHKKTEQKGTDLFLPNLHPNVEGRIIELQ